MKRRLKHVLKCASCILLSSILLSFEVIPYSAPVPVHASLPMAEAALYLWEVFMASQGYYLTTRDDYVKSFQAYGTFYNNLSATEQANYVTADEFSSIPASSTIDNVIDTASETMARWYLSAKAFFHNGYYKAANKLSNKNSLTFSREDQLIALFSSLHLKENPFELSSSFYENVNKHGLVVLSVSDDRYLERYELFTPAMDVSSISRFYITNQTMNGYPTYSYTTKTGSIGSNHFLHVSYYRNYSSYELVRSASSESYSNSSRVYLDGPFDKYGNIASVIYDSIPSHVTVYDYSGSGSYVSVSAIGAISSAANATLVGSGSKTFTLPDKITIGNTSAIPNTVKNVITETGTEDGEAATLAAEEAVLELLGDLSEELGDIKDTTENASTINASWLSKIHKVLSEAADKTYTVFGIDSLASTAKDILKGVTDSVELLTSLPNMIANSIDIVFPNAFDLGDITRTWIEALPLPIVAGINALKSIMTNIETAITALPGALSFPDTLDLGKATRTWIEAIPLSVVTAINNVLDSVNTIKETVAAFPCFGDISLDIPDTWTGPLEGIRAGTDVIAGIKGLVSSISLSLADVLTSVIALPKDIAAEIGATLTMDQELADTAALSLSSAISGHIPDFAPILGPITGMHFSDSYNYPKIQIKTPSIIKQFYKQEYIVLFDAKDYASYFVVIRNLVRAIIWIGFAYSVICHFKVRFHIG